MLKSHNWHFPILLPFNSDFIFSSPAPNFHLRQCFLLDSEHNFISQPCVSNFNISMLNMCVLLCLEIFIESFQILIFFHPRIPNFNFFSHSLANTFSPLVDLWICEMTAKNNKNNNNNGTKRKKS